MPSYLFWFLSVIMLAGGIAVIAFRNPVSSALSVVTCFVGLAGLFVGLSAFFVGIIQILVYTGAVMVLFLFIIMLLDLKNEEKTTKPLLPIAGGLLLVVLFGIQLAGVLASTPDKTAPPLNNATLASAAESLIASNEIGPQSKIALALKNGKLPDVHLIGHTLFTQYNFPLQVLGVLLLSATVGVVVLSKKTEDKTTEDRR